MLLKKKRRNFAFLFLLLTFSVSVYSQSALNKHITFQWDKVPLKLVLTQIGQKADIHFVYVSDLFNTSRPITLNAKNLTVQSILVQLFPEGQIDFHEVGKEVILSKKFSFKPQQKNTSLLYPTPLSNLNKPLVPEVPVQKTINAVQIEQPTPVVKIDTVIVVKHDTVVLEKHDTVFKTLPMESPDIQLPSVKKLIPRISIGCFSEFLLPFEDMAVGQGDVVSFDIMKHSEDQMPTFKGGIQVSYKVGSWGFQTGLGLDVKRWQVGYKYNQSITDSSKVVGYDEEITWDIKNKQNNEGEYILDSTMIITRIPLYYEDMSEVVYSERNAASYLTVPLVAEYYYSLFKDIDIRAGVGIDALFLVGANGQTLINTSQEMVSIKSMLKDFYLRYSYSLGIDYQFTEHQSLSLQTHFKTNATSIFRNDYPFVRDEYIESLSIHYAWIF